MLQAHGYKIETRCGRIETLSVLSRGVLVCTGVFDTLRPGAHPGETTKFLMLLNIIGSILDSDSRRIGSNPVGAKFQCTCNSMAECEVSILVMGVRFSSSAIFNASVIQLARIPRCQRGGCGIVLRPVLHLSLYKNRTMTYN